MPPRHEVERGMEAAGGVQGADRLLQDEIGAHTKGFLRGRSLSVQNREGDGVLVAGSVAQALQKGQTAGEIVAIDDHGVELIGRQHVGAGPGFGTDLNLNRQL